MGDNYGGPERRSHNKELRLLSQTSEDIRAGVSRIASHLESETRFREVVHEKFDKITDSLYGNGKIGLVREVDKVKDDIEHLESDFKKHLDTDFKKMSNQIADMFKWALVSALAVLGKIFWEIFSVIIDKAK